MSENFEIETKWYNAIVMRVPILRPFIVLGLMFKSIILGCVFGGFFGAWLIHFAVGLYYVSNAGLETDFSSRVSIIVFIGTVIIIIALFIVMVILLLMIIIPFIYNTIRLSIYEPFKEMVIKEYIKTNNQVVNRKNKKE